LKEWTGHIAQKVEGNSIYRILAGGISLKVTVLKSEVVVAAIMKCFGL
jgi:hypothetical protein